MLVENKPVEKIKGIPAWIIKNLKEYGNCYVRDNIYNTLVIEKLVGFEVRVRTCETVDLGYVIEKVKK